MFYIFLKSLACLATFMLFYKLCLEQLSLHNFKRFYLLSAIIASLGIPFITFYQYTEPAIVTIPEIVSTTIASGPIVFNETNFVEPTDYTSTILWSLYGLGVLIFSVKFIFNLTRLLKQITTNETLKREDYTSVLLTQKVIPHTFFNYIFFNKTDYTTHQIPKEVVLHEQTHAKQKHSIDILFLELLQVVFWFNPLLYFIKKDIKLNHEFLADASVLKYGVTTKAYQYTLLDYTTSTQHNSLANAINYPTLKKRFKIMKTQSSQKSIWLRSLLIAPLLALLVFSFSKTEIIEKEIIAVQSNHEVTPKLFKEYNDYVKILNQKSKKKKTFNGKDIKRIIAIYNLMSKQQKINATPLPEIIHELLPSKVIPKKLDPIQFKKIKNKEIYAIWLDGKAIDNISLNSLNNSEIYHYTSSFIHKNARSESFPQAEQVNLYTKAYFEKSYNKNQIKQFENELKSEMSNSKPDIKYSKTHELENRTTVIYIEQNPLNFKLNDKPTSLKSLKIDFESLNFKSPVNVALETNEESIPMSLINKLMQILGDKVIQFTLDKAYIIGDTSNNAISRSKTINETLPTINNQEIGCNNCKIGVNLEVLKKIEINTTNGDHVVSFKIKFPKAPAFEVKGNKLDASVLNYLRKVPQKEDISIFDIQTKKELLNSKIFIVLKETEKRSALSVNGIFCNDNCQFNFTRKQIINLVLATPYGVISNYKIKFPGKPTEKVIGNRINAKVVEHLASSKTGITISIFDIKSNYKDDTFNPVLITLEAHDSKHISKSPKVLKSHKNKLLPPPPPPISPNATEAERKQQKKVIDNYNKLRKEAAKNKLLPPPPPPISPNATEAEKKQQKEVIDNYNKLRKNSKEK